MKKYIICCILIVASALKAGAQDSYNDRVKKYIDQYYPLAIAEQKNAGIPASITLGQGILETEAGASELMTMANNHFGIKCKNGWVGDTFLHNDDAPNECFKKYSCAADSYRDHSDHLKRNPRYAPLFSISKTDYASWAICLKQCGYATNPQYAQQLIKIIEDFKLQDYTYSALDSSLQHNYPTIPAVRQTAALIKATPDTTHATVQKQPAPVAIVKAQPKADTVKKIAATADTATKATAIVSPVKNMADSARQKIVQQNPIVPNAKTDTIKKGPQGIVRGADSKYDSGKIVIVNGIRAFYALKGEMLLQYAVKYNVRYPRLLEMNDLADVPLPFNMYIYLEKKLASGTHAKHTVKEGETLLMVSQEEGVQIKRIMSFNYLNPNEEPATGAVLELQTMAARKPDIKMTSFAAHSRNAIVTGTDSATGSGNDYIATHKSQAEMDSIAQEQAVQPAEGSENTSYVAGSDYKGEVENKSTHDQKNTSKHEDLTGLKAELDKVVYADDSKLPQAKPAATTSKRVVEPAAKPVEKKQEKYYKVKKGDTASGIARKNNITVRQLMKWNDIDADEIRAGQNLRVKQ